MIFLKSRKNNDPPLQPPMPSLPPVPPQQLQQTMPPRPPPRPQIIPPPLPSVPSLPSLPQPLQTLRPPRPAPPTTLPLQQPFLPAPQPSSQMHSAWGIHAIGRSGERPDTESSIAARVNQYPWELKAGDHLRDYERSFHILYVLRHIMWILCSTFP